MAAVVTSEVVFVGYTQATRNDKKAETIRSTSALLRMPAFWKLLNVEEIILHQFETYLERLGVFFLRKHSLIAQNIMKIARN